MPNIMYKKKYIYIYIYIYKSDIFWHDGHFQRLIEGTEKIKCNDYITSNGK